MFEQAFVEGTGKTHRPWTVVVSSLGQLALVGLGVLLPLVHTEVIPGVRLTWIFFGPGQPPARRQEGIKPVRRTKSPPRPYVQGRLQEPSTIPNQVAQIIDEVPEIGSGSTGSEEGFIGGTGDLFGPMHPVLKGLAPPPVRPPEVRAEPVQKTTKTPRIRVGGLVQPPTPVYTPRPEYPLLARQVRVSGVVNLEAVIGVDGRVRSLRLVSGHPLLVNAAVNAVRQWRYTPILLNSEPVEIVMQIDVKFFLQ